MEDARRDEIQDGLRGKEPEAPEQELPASERNGGSKHVRRVASDSGTD